MNPNLTELSLKVHEANKKWWVNPSTGQRIERNKCEILVLIHSEISEALEGVRKDLMDDHLPNRKMEEVELVDAVIRIMDYMGAHNIDMQAIFDEKMAYNAKRIDHTLEARLQKNGKKF